MVTAQTKTSPAERAASGESAALPDLISLRAISNRALKSDTLPTRIKIFNWGDNPSTKGNFKVGERSLERLAARQRSFGYERVALDYNHCSVPGSPEHEQLFQAGQPPIIFGYGRPHLVKDDGLYLEDMEWTPLGAEKARNFEDLSPAASAECGEIDFIHSVALTTNGCLHDVTFFSAERGAATRSADQRAIAINPPRPIGSRSENKTTMTTSSNQFITLAALAGALGLAAEAGEADVTRKLQKLAALEPLAGLLVPDGKTVLLSATVDGRTVSVAPEDIVRLAARLERLEADVRAGGEAARQIECGRLLTLLAAEGKTPINPNSGKAYTAEELRQLDLPTLKLLHANTPVTVPLSARTRPATAGNGIDPNLKGRARTIAAFEAATRN